MTQSLLATFDGAVLRLEEPLALKPNTRVRITVEALPEGEAEAYSFLKVAQSLNVEGPPDWSTRVKDRV